MKSGPTLASSINFVFMQYLLCFLVMLLQMGKSQEDGWWACKDGRRLIGDIYVCDGRFHCTDGSDESDEVCSKWNCSEEYWKCGSNECIKQDYVCDRNVRHINTLGSVSACQDGSDESDGVCSDWKCMEGHWKCGSNECIREWYVCDGKDNCEDGSDEAGDVCFTWNCTARYRKCKDRRQCVHKNAVCDSSSNCNDGSDEDPAMCSEWNCTANHWKCKDGLTCVYNPHLCDSKYNCNDRSDEAAELCEEDWLCPPGTWREYGKIYCRYSITFNYIYLVYADEKSCPEGFLLCSDEIHCLVDSRWCDGYRFLYHSLLSLYGCPDLSDEGAICEHWECLPDYWKCANNLKCIKSERVCDGRDDCNDGSDERTICEYWECLPDYWKCADNRCIERKYVCDSNNNCNDESDEGVICEHWDCLPDYWKCADNVMCIATKYVCDGKGFDDSWSINNIFGCKDGSDEHNQLCGCSNKNDWPCLDGDGCVSPKLVCDGYDSCNDGSDELAATCEHWNCSSGMMKCANMRCIDFNHACEGHLQCNEDSAEELCQNWSCRDNWWECKDGNKCIKESSLCDGKVDCNDKSDEEFNFCTEYNCLAGYRKCANNDYCIKKDKICDGEYDCRDSSDELCNDGCLKVQLGSRRPIIRKCQEDHSVCVPVEYYCDGIAHCPDASDEAESGCKCEDWGLNSCYGDGKPFCFNPDWRVGQTFTEITRKCTSPINDTENIAYKMKNDISKFLIKLKADRPHPHTDTHTAYRHTDKHLRLVMTCIALCCTRQSRAPNIDRCAPEILP